MNRRTFLASGAVTASLATAGCQALNSVMGSGDDSSGNSDDSGLGEMKRVTPGDETADSERTSGAGSPGGLTPGARAWETTESATDDRAVATVVSPTEFEFVVNKCNRAMATTELGTIEGTLEVTFDWVVDPEQWYENPIFRVREGGSVLEMDGETGIDKEKATVTRGTFDGRTEVDGSPTVEMGIVPSEPCSNADHADTRFRVRNLSIRLV